MVPNVPFPDYLIGGWVNLQNIVGPEFIVGQQGTIPASLNGFFAGFLFPDDHQNRFIGCDGDIVMQTLIFIIALKAPQ